MLDNTIVVFLSDNGGEARELMDHFPEYYGKSFNTNYQNMGEKGTFVEYGPEWAQVSMTPFSSFKSSASEGGIRAPLIISYPKAVPMAQRTDAFASVIDVVPTLLQFAGVKPPSSQELAGRSMVSLLSGASSQLYPGDVSISQELSGGAAVYQGDYKLVRNIPPFGDRKWHLYNLRADPTESKDLADAEPDRVKRAPRPELVARELLRVCSPGGTIAMANWTAEEFVGQMFKTFAPSFWRLRECRLQ